MNRIVVSYECCNDMFYIRLNAEFDIQYMIQTDRLYFVKYVKVDVSCIEEVNCEEIYDNWLKALFRNFANYKNDFNTERNILFYIAKEYAQLFAKY